MDDESLDKLLARWRRGDETAAAAIYKRFQGRLLQLTSPRIRAMLRPKVQPESVVLHTMEYVLRKIREGDYAPRTSGEFLKLATLVAENKIRNLWEYFTATIRDVRREHQDLPGVPPREPAHDDDHIARFALIEELERAQRILPPKLFKVLELRLDGHSSAEIGDILGTTRQTISRHCREIARRLGYVALHPQEK